MGKLTDLLIGILLYVVIYLFTGGLFTLFLRLVVYFSGTPLYLGDIGKVAIAFFVYMVFILVTNGSIYLVSKRFKDKQNLQRLLNILAYCVFSSIFIDILATYLNSSF